MNENNIFVKKKKKSIHKNNILKKRGFKMKCEMGRHTAKKTARIPKSNHHFEEPMKKSRAARTILHHSAKPSHCCDQRSMPATTPPSSPFASRSLNGHVGWPRSHHWFTAGTWPNQLSWPITIEAHESWHHFFILFLLVFSLTTWTQ